MNDERRPLEEAAVGQQGEDSTPGAPPVNPSVTALADAIEDDEEFVGDRWPERVLEELAGRPGPEAAEWRKAAEEEIGRRGSRDHRLEAHRRLQAAQRDAGSGPVGLLLSDVKPEPIEWLWHGRIARGKVTLIDGDPGRGKSVLTIDMAARLTRGRGWPDGQACPQGGVVILSAEDGLADTIRPRLDAAGGDPEQVLALEVAGADDHPVVLPDDLAYVEAAVCRVEALMVIVDPLMAYLNAEVNAHRDQDVRRALRPLKDLAERLNVAVVVVRHLNKAAGVPALYRGGGSIGIVGAARIGLVVGADPRDQDLRVLAPVKANLSKAPPALAFRLVEATNRTVMLRWEEGTSDLTAEQLLALPSGTGSHVGNIEAGIDFLEEVLAEGPMASNRVDMLREEAGISTRTLERAKAKIGVQSRPDGFGKPWVVQLPSVRQVSPESATPGDGGDWRNLADTDGRSEQCPKCGSAPSPALAAIGTLICSGCGHEWPPARCRCGSTTRATNGQCIRGHDWEPA